MSFWDYASPFLPPPSLDNNRLLNLANWSFAGSFHVLWQAILVQMLSRSPKIELFQKSNRKLPPSAIFYLHSFLWWGFFFECNEYTFVNLGNIVFVMFTGSNWLMNGFRFNRQFSLWESNLLTISLSLVHFQIPKYDNDWSLDAICDCSRLISLHIQYPRIILFKWFIINECYHYRIYQLR